MNINIDIRKKFVDFFSEHNHRHLESFSIVPEDDHSLLLINSGMAPLKQFFLGGAVPPYCNVATIQKCIRAGGKHNDLEEVGFTKRHHTFFEMCGNFSFGGYSNEVAIRLAWDFLIKHLLLDPKRLHVTVHPDDEISYAVWANIINISHIHKVSANQWSMGGDGPCGKCTEIFFDNGEHLEGNFEEGDRYIEIWNIVIMSQQMKDGIVSDLKPICIDTGAGLERLEAVCSGLDDTYRIPLFANTIQKIGGKIDEPSYRIIVDHARAIIFMISDGVLPGANGREYVLRRIIRRAVFYEIKTEKTDILLDAIKEIIDSMCGHYSEILSHKKIIIEQTIAEASQFRDNCMAGLNKLEKMTVNMENNIISGEVMFKLYDTYGLPLETIQDAAKAKNFILDMDSFNAIMEEYRENSKSKKMHTYDTKVTTELLIYEYDPNNNYYATALEVGEDYIICDKTIFYPNSGGQESDTGEIVGLNWKLQVKEVIKSGNLIVHKGEFIGRNENSIAGEQCKLVINYQRRWALMQHHSASHILLYVLRKYFGDETVQQGSLIKENSLRLDFIGPKLTGDIIIKIENDVNALIQQNIPTWVRYMSKYEAKEINAIAAFGEKYPDNVRVVAVCGRPELCCGTHVQHSGEIGIFMITNECKIGAGISRITAVVGMEAVNEINKIRDRNISLALKCDSLLTKLKKLETMQKSEVKELLSKEINNVKINCIIYKNGNKQNILKDIDHYNKDFDIIIVINKVENNINCYVKTKQLNAKDILSNMLEKYHGKCGGKDDFAQGGCDIDDLNKFIAQCFDVLHIYLG